MGIMDIIIWSSVTFVFYVAGILIFYWFRTRKMLKKKTGDMPAIAKELKPGMEVVFAGGLIGTYLGADKKYTIARIKLGDNEIEVAFYSISNILKK